MPAAGVVAVNDQGEILLQRRRDTGQWALPMGKQEIGETVTQCAVRETLEETGVQVEIVGLVGSHRRGSSRRLTIAGVPAAVRSREDAAYG